MLLKLEKPQKNLTVGKLYPVLGIQTDSKGQVSYLILDNTHYTEVPYLTGYFTPRYYPSNTFKVVDEQAPSDWIKVRRRNWFSVTEYQGYEFLLKGHKSEVSLSHGQEPERSTFFHLLQELFTKHNLGDLIPMFTPIPSADLKSYEARPEPLCKYVLDTQTLQLLESGNKRNVFDFDTATGSITREEKVWTLNWENPVYQDSMYLRILNPIVEYEYPSQGDDSSGDNLSFMFELEFSKSNQYLAVSPHKPGRFLVKFKQKIYSIVFTGLEARYDV